MKSKATTYKAEILALWGENETRVKDIAALAARLDDLESIMVNVVVDESDHQVRLHKLETVGATNDRIFAELLGDSAEFAARLDALERRLVELERGGQLVVPGETSEWVRRDGCLVYDLDVTESHE